MKFIKRIILIIKLYFYINRDIFIKFIIKIYGRIPKNKKIIKILD